jgi:hypothetical protein
MADRQIELTLDCEGRRLRRRFSAQCRLSRVLEAAARAFELPGQGEGYRLTKADGSALTAGRLYELGLRDGEVLMVEIER